MARFLTGLYHAADECSDGKIYGQPDDPSGRSGLLPVCRMGMGDEERGGGDRIGGKISDGDEENVEFYREISGASCDRGDSLLYAGAR